MTETGRYCEKRANSMWIFFFASFFFPSKFLSEEMRTPRDVLPLPCHLLLSVYVCASDCAIIAVAVDED